MSLGRVSYQRTRVFAEVAKRGGDASGDATASGCDQNFWHSGSPIPSTAPSSSDTASIIRFGSFEYWHGIWKNCSVIRNRYKRYSRGRIATDWQLTAHPRPPIGLC